MFEAGVNGDYERAHDYYSRSLSIAREIGDRNQELYALGNLGFAAGVLGNFSKAKEYLEQALMIARESGNTYMEIYMLINLSANTGLQRQAEAASAYARNAIEMSQKIGEQSGEAWGWLYLGHAQLLLDEQKQSHISFTHSIEIRENLNQPALSMEPIAGLVEAGLHAGDLESASQATERIMTHLDNGGNLNGADEPLRVYYVCYQLLQKKEDPRSTRVLQAAIQMLEAQLSKFKDEHLRQMYVENVPWRHAIQSAAQQLARS
jgi:ATP/maltotriose-dependent transcriptional regulator MalT